MYSVIPEDKNNKETKSVLNCPKYDSTQPNMILVCFDYLVQQNLDVIQMKY